MPFYPVKLDQEVCRLLRVLDLEFKAGILISFTSVDPIIIKIKVPLLLPPLLFSSITLRYVPLFLATLSLLWQRSHLTDSACQCLITLGRDREAYSAYFANTHANLGRLLEWAYSFHTWTSQPLSLILETLSPLSARNYSLSSSSVVFPRIASITAIVSNTPLANNPTETISGLTSSYLFFLSQSLCSSPNLANIVPSFPSNVITAPNPTIYASIRRSTFILPPLPSPATPP